MDGFLGIRFSRRGLGIDGPGLEIFLLDLGKNGFRDVLVLRVGDSRGIILRVLRYNAKVSLYF